MYNSWSMQSKEIHFYLSPHEPLSQVMVYLFTLSNTSHHSVNLAFHMSSTSASQHKKKICINLFMIFNSIYPYICLKKTQPFLLWVPITQRLSESSLTSIDLVVLRGKNHFQCFRGFKQNFIVFFNEGEIIYYVGGENSPKTRE